MTSATYSFHPTPVGTAVSVLVDDALACLHVVATPDDVAVDGIARALGLPLALDASPRVGAQLEEYFAGTRTTFDLDLDWRLVDGFARAALEAITTIPYGETASYGEVAVLAGSPGAARAVGSACARSPFSLVVPVHRVIRADGSLGEYGGHADIKRLLLEREGAILLGS